MPRCTYQGSHHAASEVHPLELIPHGCSLHVRINPRKAQITLICPIEIAICCYSLRVCSDWYVLQTSLQNIARRGMQHELLIHLAQPMDWDKLGEEVSHIAGDHDQNKTSLILACD